MQRDRYRVLLTLGAALLALSACAPKPVVESVWPRADTERVAAAPAPVTRWPLTGLPAGTESTMVPPPVLVPMTVGSAELRDADLVFEWPAAKGTRLQALFQSQVPPVPVGPVATAQAVDLPIARAYDAALAHVGPLPHSVDASGIPDAGDGDRPHAYSGVPKGRAVDVAAIQSAEASGYAAAPVFSWADRSPARDGASRIREASIPFSQDDRVTWTWNARVGAYERSVRGVKSPVPPVRAVNVIVIWVPGGVGGRPARYVGLGGRASLFRGGDKFVAHWQGSSDAPLRVLGEDGAPLPLTPGATWVEVVPNAVDITLR